MFGIGKTKRDVLEGLKGSANLDGGTTSETAVTISWLTTSSVAVLNPVWSPAGTISYAVTADTLTISSTAEETDLDVAYVVYK